MALTRLLAAYGVRPDMVMGHSLGEYGALVAAGALDFEHALEAVSARGQRDGQPRLERQRRDGRRVRPARRHRADRRVVDGYVVVANVNSPNQAVIGGATAAVEEAIAALHEPA